MADPHPSQLIALVFAKRPNNVDPQAWQHLFSTLTSSLQTHFDHLDGSSPPQIRFLDHQDPTTASSGRVAELRLPTTTASCPSLQECKTLTNLDLIKNIESKYAVEIFLQPGDLYAKHRTPGLAVFDMDSTLIRQEVIDELARAVGLYDEVSAITEAAMRGEVPFTDFSTSLRARVSLLKGVPVSVWETLKRDVITFTPGAKELVQVLRGKGWKCAVLSGGFAPLAEWVGEELGLDYAFANHLVEDSVRGVLTGELVRDAPIVDGTRKRELLLQVAGENAIPLGNCVAVGDGANDLLMMEVAGLGVAFNAKEKVQVLAPSRLNSGSLIDVLYVLGYTKGAIDEVLGGSSR